MLAGAEVAVGAAGVQRCSGIDGPRSPSTGCFIQSLDISGHLGVNQRPKLSSDWINQYA